MKLPPELHAIAASFPHPLLFATVSGAHLYGFPSADSDWDLRGCHVLPPRAVLGLREPDETDERLGAEGGLDLDLVTHDVRKFCGLLLRRNGYVLEQLLSPLVVITTPAHARLIDLVPQLVTPHHAHHYLGFARNQWRMFCSAPRVKTLVYVYRVLLTGIHLMRSGLVQASLPDLLEDYPQPGVAELVAQKIHGAEKQAMTPADVALHRPRIQALTQRLEDERDRSRLPDQPTAFAALDELVAEVRMTLHGFPPC